MDWISKLALISVNIVHRLDIETRTDIGEYCPSNRFDIETRTDIGEYCQLYGYRNSHSYR